MTTSPLIYVAGHRGLVGSAIVQQLQAQGYANILMRTSKELDLTDQHAVRNFFEQHAPEYVFLAAAKVGGIHANNIYRGEFIYKNLMIQTNIIHQAYMNNAKRLVFLGSSCIYPKFAPQPIQEEYLLTGELEPTNSPYAVAKIAGIEMCDAYNKQYNTSFVPVMPTNLYGSRDNFDLETSHVLPAMIRKFHLAKLAQESRWADIEADMQHFGGIPLDIKNELKRPEGPRVVLWGSGLPKREFLHVDDLAQACIYICFQTQTTELVNIGVGEDISITDLANLIAKIVGFDGETVWDASKPDGTPRKLLDVSKLHATGWKATITLRQGIEHVYDWYRAQAS